MSQPHMDNNDLARFLDGAMPEEERAGTVAHLSRDGADSELAADAGYVLRELEAEDGAVHPAPADEDDADTGTDARVVPLRPPSTRRAWRRPPARWLALAAVLAGVLLVPLALSRSGSPGPGDFAPLLAGRDAGLPTGWTERDRWSVSRGPGDVAAENALAARLGALNVDLELAIAARQEEQTALLAAQIAAIVENAPWSGSGLVTPTYREIAARAGEPPEALAATLDEARERLAMLVDADHFALGAWAEAADLAARSRDAAFFRARASRRMLDRAAELPSLDDETRATAQAIRAAARSDPPEWAVLLRHTQQLLRQVAG